MEFVVGLWSVPTASASFTNADVNQRIDDLETAVEALGAYITQTTFPADQRIRGIFVAPEYFLAHENAGTIDSSGVIERAISVQERDACVERIRRFSRSHSHILIIPGTIAWKKTFDRNGGDTKTVDRRQRGAKQVEYFINLDKQETLRGMTADAMDRTKTITYYTPSASARRTIILGKTDVTEQVEGRSYTVKAGIKYYIRNTAYAFLNGEIVYKYHKRGDFYESINTDDAVFIPSFKRPVVSLPVTPTQSLSFGFEICVDHNMGILKRLIREQNIREPDFHIISSAAVENDESNMGMRDGGYMLHASSRNNYTQVFQRIGNTKTQISSDAQITCCYDPLRFWNISVATGAHTLLADVAGALKTYDKSKTIFASAASKNAYTTLLDLHGKGDEAGLRSHLDWYLAKPGARQPQGAGSQIPADKRFFKLLSAFKY